MKKIICTVLCICFLGMARAQYIPDYKAQGDRSFKIGAWYEAAHYYQKALKKPKATEADYLYYQMAEACRHYENYPEAEGWYKKVLDSVNLEKYPLTRLWYSVCLRANQHLEEAIMQLQQFVIYHKINDTYVDIANRELQNCWFAQKQYRNPSFNPISRLLQKWGSGDGNYALFTRGDTSWFTSTRFITANGNVNKIYTTSVGSDAVMIVPKGEKEKTDYGTPALTADGRRMYYTRWVKPGDKGNHAIYYSELKNGIWDEPVKLNEKADQLGFNTVQPSLSADGKRLFFASDKPGGQGGYDIWMSNLDDAGQPLDALNLGKIVNTPFDEQAPYFDNVNRRLVFSSKGFIGLGGYDLFESFLTAGSWSVPANLGYPVNSTRDDIYYSQDSNDKHRFYFSSDRESDCCLSLFEGRVKDVFIEGVINDCAGANNLNEVQIKLIDSATKETLANTIADATGKYRFKVTHAGSYNISMSKAGYLTKITPVKLLGIQSDTLISGNSCLQKYETEKAIVLENIEYDFDKAVLRPASEIVLNKLVSTLKDNPSISIELSSHTDSLGSDVYNLKLSQARAQVCVDYLIAHGISNDRLTAKGCGKSKPRAPNSLPNGQDNPEGRQLNRRTEFIILKKG